MVLRNVFSKRFGTVAKLVGEGAKKKDHCKSSGPYGRNVGDAKIILLRTLR